jgi:hypothetical protein
MIRGGSGAATTPSSSHDLQARFSRLVTRPKYCAGLQLQQLQLLAAQLLAGGTVLLDPMLAQPLLQQLDLQLRIL